jgi:hypothetical protein
LLARVLVVLAVVGEVPVAVVMTTKAIATLVNFLIPINPKIYNVFVSFIPFNPSFFVIIIHS